MVLPAFSTLIANQAFFMAVDRIFNENILVNLEVLVNISDNKFVFLYKTKINIYSLIEGLAVCKPSGKIL